MKPDTGKKFQCFSRFEGQTQMYLSRFTIQFPFIRLKSLFACLAKNIDIQKTIYLFYLSIKVYFIFLDTL